MSQRMATPQQQRTQAPPQQQMTQAPPQQQMTHAPPQQQMTQGHPQQQVAVMQAPMGQRCPVCGFTGPPMITYELNGTGILAIILCILLLGGLLIGFCIAIYICMSPGPDSSCHDPHIKCAHCNAPAAVAPVQVYA